MACPQGGDLEDPERFLDPAGEACDAKPIFAASCAGSICHDGDAPLGGVDLLAPGVEDRLLGVPASYANVSNPEDCPEQPELLIDPENPAQSLLLTKIHGTHQCGDGMPVPNPPGLAANDRDCIESWVQQVIANGPGSGSGGASGTGGGAGMSGATGSGGADGTGGTPMTADPLRIEAECAFGAATGDCDGTTGSYMGEAMLETGDTAIGYFSDGTWLSYADVDLTGHTRLRFHYAKESTGGSIEVRLDSATGTVIGTFAPTATASWTTYEDGVIEITPTEGTHDIYVLATEAMYVANLDWIEFFAE